MNTEFSKIHWWFILLTIESIFFWSHRDYLWNRNTNTKIYYWWILWNSKKKKWNYKQTLEHIFRFNTKTKTKRNYICPNWLQTHSPNYHSQVANCLVENSMIERYSIWNCIIISPLGHIKPFELDTSTSFSPHHSSVILVRIKSFWWGFHITHFSWITIVFNYDIFHRSILPINSRLGFLYMYFSNFPPINQKGSDILMPYEETMARLDFATTLSSIVAGSFALIQDIEGSFLFV